MHVCKILVALFYFNRYEQEACENDKLQASSLVPISMAKMLY